MGRFWLAVVLWPTAALGLASEPPFGVFETTPARKAAPSYRTTGVWSLVGHGGDALVQWQCTSFVGQSGQSAKADATISLKPQAAAGRLGVTILQERDQTNQSAGRMTATVAAAVQGLGGATVEVMLEITDPQTAAGVYSTVVDVTVSSL